MKRSALAALLVGLLGLLATPARAHKPSDSYLSLTRTSDALEGFWDVALRDLDRELTLDADGDGALTWGELSAREEELGRYAFAHLALTQGRETCSVERAPLALVTHSDGSYARLPFRVRCPSNESAEVLRYELFFARDPQHRSVVRLTGVQAEERTLVLTAAQRSTTLTGAAAAPPRGLLALVSEGVQHILGGLDHVLFLLALLLPSVLRPRRSDADAGRLRATLRDVVKVVTAFTAAHSLTLGLAALGVVSVDADVVEPAIAATVVLAAADNLWPMFGKDRWSVAFALGLLHGFGFSSALSDLGVDGAALLGGLFAFNAGVELGQLAIVIAFVPLAFLLRERWVYRVLILRGGSLAIVIVALVWLVERIAVPAG